LIIDKHPLLKDELFIICQFIPLISSSSQYPIEISVSQHKKYFPHELSTFTQHVNIEIKTGENIEKQFQPAQELFLILDTSGSMAGENKLVNAKLAIENIIRNMNKNDKLHLIQYNTYSSIVFEDESNQEFMLDKLRSLYSSGSTNLMAGFDQAKILLGKYSKRTSVKRLFVFSDGQINVGVTAHDQLLSEVTSMKNTFEITICSFGIGLDFDEKLMTNIADYGSGDYFFIGGADSIKKVVDIAYKGFQALMGSKAYLKITTKNDARIVDIYGYEDLKKDENEIIPIGDIRFNDQMNILLKTEIKITEKLLEKSQIDYMIIELWMTDIMDHRSKLIATESILFSISENEEELNDLNKLVEYLVQLQNIQRREKQVTQLLREKHTKQAHEAKKVLVDEVQKTVSSLANEKPKNEQEKETLEYIIHQANVIHRRSMSMETLFEQDGITNEELLLQNEYYTKFNAKFRKSYDDL
jgi:Ca-activated chloride channel family protein